MFTIILLLLLRSLTNGLYDDSVLKRYLTTYKEIHSTIPLGTSVHVTVLPIRHPSTKPIYDVVSPHPRKRRTLRSGALLKF